MPLAHEIKRQSRGDRAGELGQDVGKQFAGGGAAAGKQADRDRRVEMTAGNMADRIGHGHNGQTKRQRNADKTDADLGEFRRQHGAAAAAENQPKCADELGREFFR